MSKNILKQISVKGSTGKSYKVSQMKDKTWQCSCPRWVNSTPRKDCKHIIAAKKGKTEVKKTEKSNGKSILSRKTTRAAVISLLLQKKNQMVPMPIVIATVSKVTGHDKKKVPGKIKARTKMFTSYAKQNDLKFVASSSGLKFAKV